MDHQVTLSPWNIQNLITSVLHSISTPELSMNQVDTQAARKWWLSSNILSWLDAYSTTMHAFGKDAGASTHQHVVRLLVTILEIPLRKFKLQ